MARLGFEVGDVKYGCGKFHELSVWGYNNSNTVPLASYQK